MGLAVTQTAAHQRSGPGCIARIERVQIDQAEPLITLAKCFDDARERSNRDRMIATNRNRQLVRVNNAFRLSCQPFTSFVNLRKVLRLIFGFWTRAWLLYR